jgi:predicted nucleic acid-binding protein
LERFINNAERRILLDGIYRLAEITTNLPEVNLSPDPDDNKIIATALAGKADYFVSGDKADFLFLSSAHIVFIITARQMVEILKKSS